MYLKRLEVKGFKSFADKIELEFGKGITAVVGPNGSGKSNVSDSIRWVLGEQSARTLRGAKMEDVIFAGTENRKGLGAAEVSLIIDNSSGRIPLDYSEITVSRRLYRSGESEYLLNGTSCRLKDIVEVFMDTGIGKDGYSLIGQGRIDEILSSRSEDRRNLFEEAAGIVKYKTRKQEAERKLENTRQNLIRILDIIMELEEQIEPLNNQSQVAKRYLSFKEELKGLEINVILHNYEEAKGRLEKISRNIEELIASSGEMEAKKCEFLKELQELKTELENIDREYDELNNIRIDIEKSHENKQGNLRLLNERHDNYLRDKDRIKLEIETENLRLMEIDTNLEKVLSEREISENEVLGLREKIEEISIKYNEENERYNKLQGQIEDKKSDAIQLLKTSSEYNNKLNSSQVIEDNLNNRSSQLNRDISFRRSKVDQLDGEINKINTMIVHLEDKLKYYKELLEIEAQRQKNLENTGNLLKNEKEKTFERLKTLEARQRALRDMEREMEGFNRAVKAVISKFRDGEKVFGAISDLIEVPKGYETAVEIALGAAIQNIVVDNEYTAGEMIDYLKSNNLGRATFLPLTTIKPRDLNLNVNNLKINGYLGTASSIVKFNSKFANAVSNLLGRILICDNLESARVLAKRTDFSHRIVTLEGDVINSGGSFTGGSVGAKGSGVFTRKNEINELEVSLENLKKDSNEINVKIVENNKEIETLKQSVNDINSNIQEFTININNEKTKANSIIREKNSYFEYIKDMEIELEQLQIEFKNNAKMMEEYRLRIKQITEEQKEIDEIISELQRNYSSLRDEREIITSKLTDQKIVYAEKNKVLEAMLQNQTHLYKEKELNRQKIFTYENQLQELGNKIMEIEDEIKSKISEIQKTAENIIDIKDKVFNLEVKKKDKALSIGSKEKDISGIEENIKSLTTSVHKFELSKSKIEADEELLINKLWEDYELTIPQAEKYRSDIKNISEAIRRVNELKNSIKALGDVNVNAIEEYKKVTERYEFLKNQEQDLQHAEKALVDIIGEMTEKMKVQFEEKFKIIRQNFNETFRELFGGGNADLRLEDDDVLNSGIEIIVQPPGKKLQSLSLLSGGERGLSAIALIFAILKMKPTPFCVLDEIEAALDDANVNRFAEFLKGYSRNTQFIIITHRKGSMAVSDSLYGITMEEKGVSKIVSLKLRGGKE